MMSSETATVASRMLFPFPTRSRTRFLYCTMPTTHIKYFEIDEIHLLHDEHGPSSRVLLRGQFGAWSKPQITFILSACPLHYQITRMSPFFSACDLVLSQALDS